MRVHRAELWDPTTEAYGGRVVGTAGDSLLIEFQSAVAAVESSLAVQRGMADRNAGIEADRRIRLRIGVNLGEVVVEGEDIFGDGVNVAARLEALADADGVCISDDVMRQIRGKLESDFRDGGEVELKNIPAPVRVWHWLAEASTVKEVEAPLALPDKPSIAVLPFDNMSGDREQEYFSDGLTEDIITGLSYNNGIFVIARNTSFTYKGSAVDVRAVGRELGVRYIMEGSVRRGGNRARVTAQVIDTADDRHVWADRYDATLDDIFTLQDEISANVLRAVGSEITRAEIERVRNKRSRNLDAWDRYLQALPSFYEIEQGEFERASSLLEEAIDLDPNFSTAYATLPRGYVMAGLHGWGLRTIDGLAKADELARQAIALDLQDPLAHVALGFVYIVKSEPSRPVDELNRALELNPNSSVAHGLISIALAFVGESENAITEGRLAERSSPRDPERFYWYIGIMNPHFSEKRYEETAMAARQAIVLQSNFYGGHLILAAASAHCGRIEEAKAAMIETLKFAPRLTLKGVRRNPLYQSEEVLERLIEGLRISGCPEV